MFFIRCGSDLLSHVLRRSTISAVALNGRVRDGIGCFAHAMTTTPKKEHQVPSHVRLMLCMYLEDQSKVSLLLDQIKPIEQLVPVN